jgi:chromosome segregation ATPase
MQYLIGQMLICLLGAALLGVVIGWIWWGMRLRQSRERAADLEQKVSKLTGYPARLTDMEATHAAYVASKNEEEAKCKARIAELEPLAAKVPDLQTSLTAKTAQITALQAELDNLVKTKDAQIADHLQAHKDKDARLAALSVRVSELEPVAQRVPQLEEQIAHHADANKEKDEHIEQLLAQVDDLKASHTEKDSRISQLLPLAALVPALKSEVDQHLTAHAEKDARIAQLGAAVEQRSAALAEQDLQIEDLAAHVDQHAATIGEKDEHIGYLRSQVEAQVAELTGKHSKIAELAPLAALVPQLNSQIAQMNSALAEKDAKIAEAAPLAAMVPHLNAHIADIGSEKDAKIAELAPLAALVPQLNAQIARIVSEKDEHIGALLSRVEELQGNQYEHDLTARKLKMAEASVRAHQAEIVKLNDLLLAKPPEAPKNTMAAAAGVATGLATATVLGYYDFNEGKAPEPAPPAPEPDHTAAAKEAEIASLRSKIAAIEAEPDPDARRQILFTAKNAELTHLKAVLNSLLQPLNPDDIALRAYHYAKERGFQGGSETEDWLRAERDVQHQRLAAAWDNTRGAGTLY